ncbi:MAG TPA: tetratricopeptide repeat protein [Opitutaceae bacterium]
MVSFISVIKQFLGFLARIGRGMHASEITMLKPILVLALALNPIATLSAADASVTEKALQEYLTSDAQQIPEDAAYAAYLKLNGGVDPALFDVPAAPTEPADRIQDLLPTQEQWDENAKKAEAKDRSALVLLGLAYAEGYRVPRDPERAIACFEAANKLRDAKGGFYFARCLELNYGKAWISNPRTRDIMEGNYEIAADKGVADAAYYAGYYRKYTLRLEDEQMVRYLRKAVDQGHAAAQYELGLQYLWGRGSLKSNRQAVRLMSASAKQGYTKAQREIAGWYLGFDGIPKDPALAYAWLRTAEANGSSDTKALLKQIESALPKKDRELAEKLAAEFIKKYKAKPAANVLVAFD